MSPHKLQFRQRADNSGWKDISRSAPPTPPPYGRPDSKGGHPLRSLAEIRGWIRQIRENILEDAFGSPLSPHKLQFRQRADNSGWKDISRSAPPTPPPYGRPDSKGGHPLRSLAEIRGWIRQIRENILEDAFGSPLSPHKLQFRQRADNSGWKDISRSAPPTPPPYGRPDSGGGHLLRSLAEIRGWIRQIRENILEDAFGSPLFPHKIQFRQRADNSGWKDISRSVPHPQITACKTQKWPPPLRSGHLHYYDI
ncbi:hypothetical protein PAEVO_62460 [Paenibacillus sp. GM2FR]|nr:hypothetical protein PAEVO_62460 [Paenibacillus sp. GM2FR]